MKNSMKITALFGLAALLGATACNDAEYDTLGTRAFIYESSTGVNTKVTITDAGGDADIMICLSDKMSKDAVFKFVVDESVLDLYNAEQASSYVAMPETGFEMESEITIPAGSYSSAGTRIHIKPLTKEMIGETYAIPLRLVSVDGSVPTTATTSTYVITTEAVTTSSYPMWTGGAGLVADNFAETLPQFTVECRFQISDTNNRNRAVFTNGGSVLLRFEDPQNDTADHKKHSLVQFQGEGWYLNPSLSFATNKWQHLALTYDGTAVTLYVNGTFAGTKEGVADPAFNNAMWFGGDAGGGHGTGNSWWSGCKILCSELRVWSVCRSAAQVQNNMTSCSSKSEGLVAYWRMNDGAGTTFEDCSGNGHTLRTSITPTWVEGIKSTDEVTPWP